MGCLRDFDFSKYVPHGSIYVETGTGHGGTLTKAANSDWFSWLYSIDMDKARLEEVSKKLPQAIYGHGLSTKVLRQWFKEGAFKTSETIFFFLDAHFPDSDYNGAPYDWRAPHAIPLEEELRLIKQYRFGCPDVIVCDDARVYKNLEWEAGKYPFDMPKGGFDFVYKMFGKKRVKINLSEQGYIIINNR